jgi:hypothetical protein
MGYKGNDDYKTKTAVTVKTTIKTEFYGDEIGGALPVITALRSRLHSSCGRLYIKTDEQTDEQTDRHI